MGEFRYDMDGDGIVTITMDMSGPVNAMNAEFDELFTGTIERLEAEEGLTGVIVTSAKKTFFAGGDLNALLAVKPGEEAALFRNVEATKARLRRLEQLPVPVVAAINGAALGGGYEVCLCCNHRIAWHSPTVQVGLPEVTLGLLPGGGGVVRMVNLLGLQPALPYLLEGKRLKADAAREAGLVDALVEDQGHLLPAAREWILAHAGDDAAAVQPWDREGHRIPGGSASSPALAQVLMVAPHMLRQKTAGRLPAPEFILDVAVAAARLDFETASRIESRRFVRLVTTPEAKNMISTFFFGLNKVNGGASRPAGEPAKTVRKVGVIGAGMMGQGIAYVSAMAGIEVVLKDLSREAAERGKAYSAGLLEKRMARGRLDAAGRDAVLARITATDRAADLEGCDLVVEAVFERLDLKHAVTREHESLLAPEAVWGSNTSTLPITHLAEASERPENFIGIHFFSPVDRMPLVEIICGDRTGAHALALAFDYARRIGKTPVVVSDSPGFFTSRTIGVQVAEALSMVGEGIHPARVENASRSLGLPVGSLTLSDEIGLELPLEIRRTHESMGLAVMEDPTPHARRVTEELVALGRIGRKAGKGFFDWSDGGKELSQEVVARYHRPDVSMATADIEDRLLFRPVIESFKCLEEGVLRNIEDGNVGSIMGIGAPPWTGGYLQFVNGYGVERFLARCEELAQRYGDRFLPPESVRNRAAAA